MKKFMTKMYVKAMLASKDVKAFIKNEQGDTNIIAIILILAIVIALAIVFRSQLNALFNRIWSGLFGQVDANF